MTEPTNPNAAIVIVQPAAQATFSKTTMAKVRLTQQHLTDTKASMINDMSTQRLSPQAMFEKIDQLQKIQVSLDAVAGAVEETVPEVFTDEDAVGMRTLKKEHDLTDVELAKLYDTNQSKVNRLLNSPIKS
ncbi:MAG TPA: hypothetical protein VF682_00440 [Pseudomonas sp.]|jgi:hypothetical protein